jgi:hypothetical protein
MNELFLFLLVGFMVATFLSWSQKPSPTTRRTGPGGCMPIIVLVLSSLLFGLLMIGR